MAIKFSLKQIFLAIYISTILYKIWKCAASDIWQSTPIQSYNIDAEFNGDHYDTTLTFT